MGPIRLLSRPLNSALFVLCRHPHERFLPSTICRYLSEPKRTEKNQRKLLTIPNVITVSRIALTPLIGHFIIEHQLSYACGLVIIAGLSDAVDGHIARTWEGQQSWLGSYLDPLADKILVSTLVVTMSYAGFFPIPLTAIILSRDVVIVVLAAYLAYLSIPKKRTGNSKSLKTPISMEASKLSKWNTGCQLVAITSSLVVPLMGLDGTPYLQGLWWLAGGTTVASGVDYLVKLPNWKKRALKLSGKINQSK